MLRERFQRMFNALQGLTSPPTPLDDHASAPLPPLGSGLTLQIPAGGYGFRKKDNESGLGDHGSVASSDSTGIRNRAQSVVIPPGTTIGRRLIPDTSDQYAGHRYVNDLLQTPDGTARPENPARAPCSWTANVGHASPLVSSLKCSCSDMDSTSGNNSPVHYTNGGPMRMSRSTQSSVAPLGSKQVSKIPAAVGDPTQATTAMNGAIIQDRSEARPNGFGLSYVRSSSSWTAESNTAHESETRSTYPAKRECRPEEIDNWVCHEVIQGRHTGATLLDSLIHRSRARDSSPSNLFYPLSSPVMRVSDSASKEPGAKLEESKQTRFNLSGISASQSPPLAFILEGPPPPGTPTAPDPRPKTTSTPDLPLNASIPGCRVDPTGPHKGNQSSPTLIPSDLQPFVVDAPSSGTTSEHDTAPIHPIELEDRPAEISAPPDLVEICDDVMDDHATHRSAFASADIACPIQRHDLENDQPCATVTPPKELPATATTATRTREISNSESGSVKVHDQSYTKCNGIFMNPNVILKGPSALCLSCLTGIDGGGCTCTRPSSIFSRRQRSVPLSKLITVVSSGLEGSWVVGLPIKRNQHASTVKALSLASFPVRPRQRKLRAGQLLRLICPYTFAFDPSTSGSGFQFGQAFGIGQTPGNTFPLSGDGGGIWSGQGPGAGLDALASQAPGFFEIPNSFEDLIQALGNSFPGPSQGSASSSVTQYVRNAPNPPVPLHPDTVRKLLLEAFAAGVGVGLSLGGARAGSSETTLDRFRPQQSNPSRVVQAEITSSIHHLAPDQPAGPSHNEANWPPDLPLVGFDAVAPGVAGLPEVQPPLDVPAQPTSAPTVVGNTQDPVGDIAWDSWIQPSVLHVDTHPSVGSHDPGVPLAGNRLLDDGTDSTIVARRSIDPSESIPLASQAHPTQAATTPTIGLESQTPGIQPEYEGNEDRLRCKHCKESFRRRYLLEDHISVVHEKRKRHSCTVEGCEKKYASHSGVMRHLKQAHLQMVNSQGVSLPSIEQGQGDIQEQTPGAGPSNRSTFRGNTRSSRAFIPYDPNSARHKSCHREGSGT